MWPLVRNGPFGDKDETLVDQIWILSLFIFDQPAAEWDKKGNECLFIYIYILLHIYIYIHFHSQARTCTNNLHLWVGAGVMAKHEQ